MHLGWIENGDIRCVYHGWKYDGTGQCVEAPAEKAGFEKNVRLGVYPTGEAFGLVYAYFGTGRTARVSTISGIARRRNHRSVDTRRRAMQLFAVVRK